MRRVDNMSLHEFTRKYFAPLLGTEGGIPQDLLEQARTLKFHVSTLQGRPHADQAGKTMQALQRFMREKSHPDTRHTHHAALAYVGNVISAFEGRGARRALTI